MTYLGSSNIQAINYSPANDSPLIVNDLLSDQHSEKRVLLDALLNVPIKEIVSAQIKKHAIQDLGESIDIEDNNITGYSELMGVKHTLNARAGNCDALTQCALLELIKTGYTGNAEVMQFTRLDHIFLVLNRPQNSDKSNWKTWGNDTVILDVWLNKVFASNQLGSIWHQYSRLPNLKRNLNETITAYEEPSLPFKEGTLPWAKRVIHDFADKADFKAASSKNCHLETWVKHTAKDFQAILSENDKEKEESSPSPKI